MPLMTQIRNNLAKAFAVFAGFFILYIVFDWGMDLTGMRPTGATDVIGVVNGKKIQYRDFSELLRQQTESFRQQRGTDPDEETERQMRSQVWNELVRQTLVEQEIERMGITVTNQEIIDIVHGPNPPEFLARQFRDSLGVFNRRAYDQAIMDPQNKVAWLQVEEALRRERKGEKLQSLLSASVRVTEGEVRQRFIEKNTTMEAEYVLFDPNRLVPDSLVEVAENEIQKYYNTNQEEFKVRPARKVKFVFFNLSPSKEDSLEVENEILHFKDQLKEGVEFQELVKTYSEGPAADAYFKHGELSREKEMAIFSAKKGDIVGPVVDFDGYHLIKVLDERKGDKEFVRASHILLRATAGPDSVEKIKLARELLTKIRNGANIETLAREYSEDPGSAQHGGDLGWTGRGGWVKPFEDAAFKARVGEVVGPVRTQFGWHIILVTGRDSRELRISSLTLHGKASARTVDAAYQRAQDFAYLANEEGFDKSAEFSAYKLQETPDFTKGSVIPGVGLNDAVMNFAFTHKVGAISEPISVTGGVAVFLVSGIREEGVRPLEEVSNIVRSQVLRQKKMARVRQQAEAFVQSLSPGANLLTSAQSLQNVTVQKTGPFKPTESPLGVGRDLKFIGRAFAMKPGEISKPFEGSRGYYVLELLSKTPFDSTQFKIERASLRDQILQEKRTRLFSDWYAALRGKAEIEDHRDKFFR